MKKVLVIRFSSIGDIVLCSPVVRALKVQLKADVHFLTKPGFAQLLESNPHIDRVHKLNSNFSETIKELTQESFDQIIDLHNNLRTKRVKTALKVPYSSFSKLNLEKWLMVNLKINRLPNLHIVNRYLACADDLNIAPDNQGLDFYIDPKTKSFRDLSLDSKISENNFIAFVIGGQHQTKMMPMEKMKELIALIKAPVLLLGGPDDEQKGDELQQTFPDQVVNAAGKFSLMESCLLLKASKLVISHDTGLMHIAAAFKKDILSIWGNTVPEFGMYPYRAGNGSEIFEVKDLSCRPCSKIGYKECPKKHFDCMNQQELKGISAKANQLFAK